MDVVAQLEKDLAQATKTRDSIKLMVLRMLKSALKNQQIEVGGDLNEAQILSVIQHEAKKRRDALEAYDKHDRPDLAAQEKAELEVIAEYLPSQLSDDELSQVVSSAIEATGATGPTDMGKVMAAVMSKVGSRADGSRVSQLVKSKLT